MEQSSSMVIENPSSGHKIMKSENNNNKVYCDGGRDVLPGMSDLWTDGLICAFEFAPRRATKLTPSATTSSSSNMFSTGQAVCSEFSKDDGIRRSTHQDRTDMRMAIGYLLAGNRISQLVHSVQIDGDWPAQTVSLADDGYGPTVADLVAPYWERPAGPTWWCHVAAGHTSVQAWLNNAKWLHPAISLALRDESRLISERMKYLLYEVPVRVAGGLLFELLGQSAGDPFDDEDDIPVVLRSWQAQNFLVTSLHIKGHVSRVNVLGITEVQELLFLGGYNAPRTVHEVIAHLASRMSRWDDRLFRKSIFGGADEIELKFVNRRNYEDMSLFSIILNQEIRRLSRQVIRVKWSLHAREEIVFELLHHLRGNAARMLLEEIRKSTRQMIEEQEAVRGRLFTIQDVIQSTVRAWLQDRSLRVTHNLAVFGGCGLVLSIVTGLFGINVDGIPGASGTPYAFALFTGILLFIGVALIAVGLLYLGLKKPVTEEQIEVRKVGAARISQDVPARGRDPCPSS
ncbi:MAGNESIUM TRANSPORTER CORA-LIKE FAMILY PROTEIN [Salix koriyanagi]|uniref:MAGNESIUM TRANSPORTER CORA-LIKE FAMILY PROTEIN n=1 Tax=Salix koriyanagi TaxID=2511006 RepID=A0A9Q0WYH1_9ROSI|nr:MAGNESIUM TRANSPORTER CORA-LIKE FAMILY PROTEIN [Salix koriyanagi]